MQNTNLLNELNELEVIESSELAVGNAFHAFKFAVTSEVAVTTDADEKQK